MAAHAVCVRPAAAAAAPLPAPHLAPRVGLRVRQQQEHAGKLPAACAGHLPAEAVQRVNACGTQLLIVQVVAKPQQLKQRQHEAPARLLLLLLLLRLLAARQPRQQAHLVEPHQRRQQRPHGGQLVLAAHHARLCSRAGARANASMRMGG